MGETLAQSKGRGGTSSRVEKRKYNGGRLEAEKKREIGEEGRGPRIRWQPWE